MPHVAAVVRALLVEHHELLRCSHRQLAQQDLVDQREYRGIGPDAERQRQNRDAGKQRVAAKTTQGKAEIGCRIHVQGWTN